MRACQLTETNVPQKMALRQQWIKKKCLTIFFEAEVSRPDVESWFSHKAEDAQTDAGNCKSHLAENASKFLASCKRFPTQPGPNCRRTHPNILRRRRIERRKLGCRFVDREVVDSWEEVGLIGRDRNSRRYVRCCCLLIGSWCKKKLWWLKGKALALFICWFVCKLFHQS